MIIHASIRDVTERRRIQDQLRENEERLRHLVEMTSAIPWEADARTWLFTYVGPKAVDLLGFPLERWYGKDFWAFQMHPDDRRDDCAACPGFGESL